jgi:hypothetical protein
MLLLKVRIHETIILPVVLYGCETWSLTVREEHKLRVFENKVLRRIFGPKRDGVMGGWRKLYNEELHNLYRFVQMCTQNCLYEHSVTTISFVALLLTEAT